MDPQIFGMGDKVDLFAIDLQLREGINVDFPFPRI
jgi:hypothetical protein